VKLWLLKRTENSVGWDEYLGFVVAADDSTRAREMAHEAAREPWWLDSSQTSIEHIGEAAYPEDRVVLDSFNAG
jgi:hypothetical protein